MKETGSNFLQKANANFARKFAIHEYFFATR